MYLLRHALKKRKKKKNSGFPLEILFKLRFCAFFFCSSRGLFVCSQKVEAHVLLFFKGTNLSGLEVCMKGWRLSVM